MLVSASAMEAAERNGIGMNPAGRVVTCKMSGGESAPRLLDPRESGWGEVNSLLLSGLNAQIGK